MPESLILALLGICSALLLDGQLLMPTRAGCAISLTAGVVAAMYALRLRFDIAVFERWASSQDPEAQMRDFDLRLQRLFPWRKPGPRSMSDRIAGAVRLRRLRNAWVGVQALAWALAMLPLLFR